MTIRYRGTDAETGNDVLLTVYDRHTAELAYREDGRWGVPITLVGIDMDYDTPLPVMGLSGGAA